MAKHFVNKNVFKSLAFVGMFHKKIEVELNGLNTIIQTLSQKRMV